MAAKTKGAIAQIIDQVIVTNGNIRAKETNMILKEILDCIELNDKGQSNVALFDIKGANLTDNRGGILNYSIKGIVSSFANVTLHLGIKESNAGNFAFKHEKPELFEVFKAILQQNPKDQLNFLVKLTRKPVRGQVLGFGIANLNLNITKEEIQIMIEPHQGDKIISGDTILTSIALHCPEGI
ncbi:hypothetical protein [Flavobacterium sp.]|uniref:hypothetical protein n=1 Tax=Flavobacterium sp. TaxID=239 RepID=UPI0039E4E509